MERVYIEKIYRFTCADCATKKEYSCKESAKAVGWAIAQDRKTCYCPACAPYHRSVGCKGASDDRQLKIV